MKPVIPLWYRLCLAIVVCIAPILVGILIEYGALPDGVRSWLTSNLGAMATIVALAMLVGTVHNAVVGRWSARRTEPIAAAQTVQRGQDS